VYNLSAPTPVTNKTMMQTVGQVLKRPAFIPTPGFVFKLAFGEAATVLLDGQRAIPARLQAAGFTFKYPTAKEALTQLLSA